jgi:hypothetical protein
MQLTLDALEVIRWLTGKHRSQDHGAVFDTFIAY